MPLFLARRILALLPVLVGITALAFLMGSLAPGDAALQLYMAKYQQPPSDNAAVEALREEMGLNNPLPVRYANWVAGALGGDLGNSYRTGRPVLSEMMASIGNTLKLSLGGIALTLLVATPLGVLASVYRNTLLDLLLRVFSLAGTSMPAFWVGYLMMYAFAVKLHWLPASGTGTWQHLVLPLVATSLFGVSVVSRLLRTALLEVLESDYVRAARARGVPTGKVVLVHALRNALIPVVTVVGSLFGHLTAGAVVVETVFAIPGMGRLILDAISFRDYPVIQGFVVFSGTLFLAVNLVVDVAYTLVDPRVSFANVRGRNG